MARIIPLTASGDPTAVTGQAILYSKDDGGVIKAFIRQSDGSISAVGGAGSSEISAANTLTFKPGSAETGPVVFNSWSSLYTKLDTLRADADESGRFKIIFDDTATTPPVVIPSGSWDMANTEWESVRGPNTFSQLLLQISEGATITNLLRITGIGVSKANTAGTPPIQLTGQLLDLNASTLASGNIADTHVIQINDTSIIRLGDRSFLSSGGGSSDGAVLIDVNDTLAVFMDGGACGIFDGAVFGDGTTSMTLYITNSSAQYGAQANFSGTLEASQFAPVWYWFLGDPNGIVSADQGKLLIDTSTGTLWKNNDSDTTWETFSGGGGSDGQRTYVFRSGSAFTGPVVFNDFNDLYAALDTARSANNGTGRYIVLIDDGDESPVVLNSGPGNTTYDFTGVHLVGIHRDANVDLEVGDDGGEGDSLDINNALWFENLNITTGSATDTPFQALGGETITLKRTKWTGAGEFVYDFLTASGTIVMDDESRLENGTNAAIRVNNGTVTLRVNGNNAFVEANALTTGVGGVLVCDINSASARVSPTQGFLAGNMTFNMNAAAGRWPADPNTVLTASKGVQVFDENTGKIWVNVDGAEEWQAEPFGTSGYVTLDTATEKTIVLAPIPSVAQGATYAVDWTFTLPVPVSGSQGFSFAIESGDGNAGYEGFGESGASVANRRYTGRTIITFGPVTGPNQDVLRSSQYVWHDPDDDSTEVRAGSDGPNANATPIDRSIRVKLTIDLAADTGEETVAHATVSRLA
jgi:hypothetical protein